MKLALCASLLAAIALTATACGSSRPASGPAPGSGAITTSRLILGGSVRCTATVASSVPAGHELDVFVSFHNLTSHPVDLQPAYGGVWLVVRSTDGTRYDTRVPLENSIGPQPTPISLAAGQSVIERPLPRLPVRWAGPLRVTPGCVMSAAPEVRVDVTSPGPPPNPKAAVSAVVAATGHLLDHCRPASPGVAVTGRIDAPDDSAPPLRTRCVVTLRPEKGFDLAQVLVTTAPPGEVPRLDPLYEQFTSPPTRPNQIAVAWQFVVTKDGATPVASADVTSSKGRGYAPDWNWSTTGPGQHAGGSVCGSVGGGGGSGTQGPVVEFVSRCR